MTQVYTKVATPEGGYLCLGRVDRDDEIIKEINEAEGLDDPAAT